MNSALADLVGRLKSIRRIGPDDVLAMRGHVYGASEVAPDDMEALLSLDAELRDAGPEWTEFLCEVSVDCVVHQSHPEDYVDDAKAAWLMGLFPTGPLSVARVEALLRVVEAADSVPAAFDAFAVGKLKDAVISAGEVTAADVGRLRRLVFAAGGEDNVGVSRAEADALFDIDAACRRPTNDPSWPDFFAKAIADSLTAVSPFQRVDREAASRDEAWLARRETLADFFRAMVRAPRGGFAMGDIRAREWQAPEAAIETAEAAAAPVTDEEARWLVGRLGDGDLSEAEARLVATLKAHATEVSDILKARFDAAPQVTAARDWGAPVFGQRRSSFG